MRAAWIVCFAHALCLPLQAQVRSSLAGITTVNAEVGVFGPGLLDEAKFRQDLMTTYTDEVRRSGISVVTGVTSTPVNAGCQVILSRRDDAGLVLYRWDSVVLDRGNIQRRRAGNSEYVVTWAANFLGSQPLNQTNDIAVSVGESCGKALVDAWLRDNPAR